jgi:glucosamine--fructose-6-phosphate aminotransferase (isomerizing)
MSLMLDEIREQPAALDRTLRRELKVFEKLKKKFQAKPPKLVVLAARGTSDNACQFGRYIIEIATRTPVAMASPSVSTLYRAAMRYEDALMVAISQSGESTDTNAVVEEAGAMGVETIGITNEAHSTLAKMASHTVLVRAGREKSVAATKTYTGQLMSLYLLAWALGAPIDLDDLKRLPDLAAATLEVEREVIERVERYRFIDHALVVGRGLNFANAFEFALKLMETCYVVAERFSSADLLHGPIAMVEQAFPAFLYTPSGVTWPVMKEMLERLQSLKADTLAITDRSNKDAPARALRIPLSLAHKGELPVDVYTPIPYIIPGQLFAAHLAAIKELDPDRPRGLSKVTRTL